MVSNFDLRSSKIHASRGVSTHFGAGLVYTPILNSMCLMTHESWDNTPKISEDRSKEAETAE